MSFQRIFMSLHKVMEHRWSINFIRIWFQHGFSRHSQWNFFLSTQTFLGLTALEDAIHHHRGKLNDLIYQSNYLMSALCLELKMNMLEYQTSHLLDARAITLFLLLAWDEVRRWNVCTHSRLTRMRKIDVQHATHYLILFTRITI